MGPRSEPLVNTTMEATPSRPQNLVVNEIKNTSALLSWNAPEFMNGVLNNYEIWYNEHRREFYQGIMGKTNLTFRLEGLASFTDYTILVRACSNCCNCSENSNAVRIKTAIGVPGAVNLQSIYDGPNSKVQLEWDRPPMAAGPIDFYEVRTTERDKHGETTTRMARTLQTQCDILLKCDSNLEMKFEVRAVNVGWSAHLKVRRRRRRSRRNVSELTFEDDDNSDYYHPSEFNHTYTRLQRNSNVGANHLLALQKIASDLAYETGSEKRHHSSVEMAKILSTDHEGVSVVESGRVVERKNLMFLCSENDVEIKKRLAKDDYRSELQSVWSQPYKHSCSGYHSAGSQVLLTFCIVVGLVILVVIVVTVKRVTKIKNVSVELPPGLQDIGDKGTGGGGGTGSNNPSSILASPEFVKVSSLFGNTNGGLAVTPDSISGEQDVARMNGFGNVLQHQFKGDFLGTGAIGATLDEFDDNDMVTAQIHHNIDLSGAEEATEDDRDADEEDEENDNSGSIETSSEMEQEQLLQSQSDCSTSSPTNSLHHQLQQQQKQFDNATKPVVLPPPSLHTQKPQQQPQSHLLTQNMIINQHLNPLHQHHPPSDMVLKPGSNGYVTVAPKVRFLVEYCAWRMVLFSGSVDIYFLSLYTYEHIL